MDKLGRLAVLVLLMWLVVVVGIGVAVTLQNGVYS